ncbi:hypothetical protein CR513_59787, partial [Mucuna pruriens]
MEAEEDKEDRLQAERELLAMEKMITPRVQAHQQYNLGEPIRGKHVWKKRQLCPSREEWWEFHRAPNHTTKECKVLKSQIEKLIQDGYLGRFVKRKENEKRITKELHNRDKSQTHGRDHDHEQN